MSAFSRVLTISAALTAALIDVAGTSAVAAPAEMSAPSSAPAAQEAFELTVTDGAVTTTLRGARLGQVFERLAQVTGLQVIGLGADADRTVSVELTDVPLRDALERLLPDRSFLLTFSGRPGIASPGRVIIVGGDRRRLVVPAAAQVVAPRVGNDAGDGESSGHDEPAVHDQPAALRARATGASDADERREGLALLVQAVGARRALPTLRDVLAQDLDTSARRMAFAYVEELGPAALDIATATATHDVDDDLRMRALQLLQLCAPRSPTAHATIAWLAGNDRAPVVRAAAAAALDGLSGAPQGY